MQVSILDQATFQSYEFRMDYITLLPFGNTSVNFYNEVNRAASFTQQCVKGSVQTQILYELISLLQKLPLEFNRLMDP